MSNTSWFHDVLLFFVFYDGRRGIFGFGRLVGQKKLENFNIGSGRGIFPTFFDILKSFIGLLIIGVLTPSKHRLFYLESNKFVLLKVSKSTLNYIINVEEQKLCWGLDIKSRRCQ